MPSSALFTSPANGRTDRRSGVCQSPTFPVAAGSCEPSLAYRRTQPTMLTCTCDSTMHTVTPSRRAGGPDLR